MHTRRSDRAGDRVRGDRQPLEGHRLAGGAEPQPDVRPARGERDRADHGGLVLHLALGRAARPRQPSSTDAVCRRASAPPASPAASRPTARSTSALIVSDAPTTDQRGALHPLAARSAAPVLADPRALRAVARLRAVVANSGNANAATGERGLDDRRAMQGAAARRCRASTPTRSRVASTGVIGVPLPTRAAAWPGSRAAAASSRADGDADFAEAIRTTDAFAEAGLPRGRAARRHRAPERPGQGRGDDLAALRDDAVLRADRRRAVGARRATCCSAVTSSARSTASASTGSCRPTTR